MALSKIKNLIKSIKIIKNWPYYIADYLHLISRKNLVYCMRNGIKIKVRPKTCDRRVVGEIFLGNHYNPRGFDIKKCDTIIDIGAHIGAFSLYSANLSKPGKVYSFEPTKENYALLLENIRMNNNLQIIPINKAVSDIKGVKEICISQSNTGGHSLISSLDDNFSTRYNIETTTLPIFIKENGINKIDLLKMDCEGSEYDILFNCPDKYLKIITKISMEYHNIDNDHNSNKLKEFLISKGFNVESKGSRLGMLYAWR